MKIISHHLYPLTLLLGVFSTPLHAHHSVMVFETTTPIVLKGQIADVRFSNPHSSIFIDVADADGKPVRWAVENSGTLAMTRERGFNEQNVRVGDPITVCGYAPKKAYSTAEELTARGTPVPDWWGSAKKFITGRLVVLKDGPHEHWSHYGPLEVCQDLVKSEQQ